MSIHRAWAQLTSETKEVWREAFPDGRVPIKSIAPQAVRFDEFKDPESVFCVDWNVMSDWQKEAFLKMVSECELMKVGVARGQDRCFLFGRSQVCLLGVGGVTFWARSEVLI